MHETAAALREWHARLLSWEAAQTDPGRVAEPSGASELRILCKLLFDSAAKTLEWQTKRRCLGRRAAALRSTLGELKRLSIAGFDLEQVWAELETRNRSLCAAARKTLERIESEFATGGGSAQCIEVASTADTAPSQDNGTLKRVRFDDERNETREFVRDQDEEVGCMSPNFFFDDDDDENDNDEFIIGHAMLEACDTMYDAGSSTSDSSERDEMDEAACGDFGANVGHEALRKFGHTSADMELNSLASDAAASVKRRALSTNAASVADESAPDCLLSDESNEKGPGHSDTCDNAIESAHNVAAPEANTAGASASGSEAQSLPQHSNANNRSEALPSHVAQLDPWIEQTPDASWSSAESPTASIDNIDDASLDSFGTDDDSGTLESSASPEDDVYYEQFFGSEASDSLRSDASPREQSFPHRKRNQYTNATMDTKSQPAENRHDSKHNAHKLSTAAPTLDNTSTCTPVTTPEPAQTSAFERCEALLRTRARSLEKFNLEEKPWQLRGEVTGHERPVDSVLDAELDFDLSVARRPRIRTHAYEAALAGNHVDEAAISDRAADSDTDTSQDTDTHVLTEASIRRRVLQRVLDQAFDDVQRRVRPSAADAAAAAAAAAPDAGAFELSQERSAQGLAELYAGRDAATAGAQGIVRGASTQTPKSPRNPLEQQVDALFGELASAIATQTEVAERVLETRSFAVADGWSLRPQKLVSDATQTVAVGEAPWMVLGRGDVPGAEAAALAEQRVARDPVREQASRLGVDTDASLRLKQGDTEASRSSRRTRRNRLKRLVRSRLRRKRETAEQRQRATEWLQEAALRDSIAAWEAKSRGRSRHESRIAGETDRDQQVVYEQALRVVQQAQAQADAQARAHVSRGQYAGIRIRKAEHVAEQPARGSTDPAHTSSIQCGGARRTRRLEPGDDRVQAGGGSGSATLYLQLRRQLDREIQRQKTSSL